MQILREELLHERNFYRFQMLHERVFILVNCYISAFFDSIVVAA